MHQPLDPYVTSLSEYQAFLFDFTSTAISRGAHALLPAQYVTQADLDSYLKALDWWPKDAPAHMQAPTLETLAQTILYTPPLEPITFATALNTLAANVVVWLESEKRNVANPNESKDERRKRLNRERVGRHRDESKMRETASPEKIAKVEEAEAYLAVVKEQRASVKASLDKDVKAAHKEFVELTRDRKKTMAHWDGVVTEAQAYVKLVKSA